MFIKELEKNKVFAQMKINDMFSQTNFNFSIHLFSYCKKQHREKYNSENIIQKARVY